MSKQGVIGISVRNMLNVLPIKKHLLLFDKLIVAEETLGISRQLVELISKHKGIDRTLYNYNNDTIEQLINEGLLEFSKINDPIIGQVKDLKGLNEKEIDITFEKVEEINIEANKLAEKIRDLVDTKNWLK